jgi:preprotein translocase subunit SecE
MWELRVHEVKGDKKIGFAKAAKNTHTNQQKVVWPNRKRMKVGY